MHSAHRLAAAEQLLLRSAKTLIECLNISRLLLEAALRDLLLESALAALMPEALVDELAQSSIRPAAPGPSSVPTMQFTLGRAGEQNPRCHLLQYL